MKIFSCPKCKNHTLNIKNGLNMFNDTRHFYGVCNNCNYNTREFYKVTELIKYLKDKGCYENPKPNYTKTTNSNVIGPPTTPRPDRNAYKGFDPPNEVMGSEKKKPNYKKISLSEARKMALDLYYETERLIIEDMMRTYARVEEDYETRSEL